LFQCVSADILYDQLGMDIDDPLSVGQIDNLAALVVYHIMEGNRVIVVAIIMIRIEIIFPLLFKDCRFFFVGKR